MATVGGSAIPRPGTRLPAPPGGLSGEASRRPWAVGYVSAPGPVPAGTWTRWHGEVEAAALAQGLPMLHVYSDEPAPTAPGGGPQQSARTGFRQMLSEIRQLADLRSGHVSVVIVPSLEHLSPTRDGSEQSVAMLLGLHLGVDVPEVERTALTPAPATRVLPGEAPHAEEAHLETHPTTGEVPAGVLLPRDTDDADDSLTATAKPGPVRDWRSNLALDFTDLLAGVPIISASAPRRSSRDH